MDKDQPNNQTFVFTYNKLLSVLLAVKEDPQSHDILKSCPDLSNLCYAIKVIKFSFSNLKSGVCSVGDSILLSSFTIVKMFLEICLLVPNVDQVKVIWGKVMEKSTDFYFIFLPPSSLPLTVRYLSTEVMALHVFISQRLNPTNNYFEDIAKRLDEDYVNLMSWLYVVDHLCILSKEHECMYFSEFLSGKNGILREENLIRKLFVSDVSVQIMILRVYLKTLSVICHEKSRKCIFENIDSLLIFFHGVYCETVEKLFWKFMYSLLPFPGEEINEKKLIMDTASKILNSFQARLDIVKPIKLNNKDVYDVIFSMAINTILKSLLWVSKDFVKHSALFEHVLSQFPKICVSYQKSFPTDARNVISRLIEDDEDLVDFLVLHLELHCVFLKESISLNAGFLSLTPWELFLELILNLSFDFSIFNDWLISNETRFLRYLVRFLKLMRLHWHHFVEACALRNSSPRFQNALTSVPTNKVLDACVSTFIKLRNSVSKLHRSGLFPYSPEPLLRHLNAIEVLFEGSDEASGSVA